MNHIQKEKITEYRNSGLSYKDIAREVNLSESAVKSFFSRKNKSVCSMCKIEITGKKRFNSMIEDALAGKIDLIVTKSVSRFARNTVDSLSTIRLLKEHNVECWFEKENIFTFDGKGELLISIMSSLAQEESRSLSENVTWGQRKRFADGY